MSEVVSNEVDAILGDLVRDGVDLAPDDQAIIREIASKWNRIGSTIAVTGGTGPIMAELVTIHSNRHRARSQKITNMTWELDKGIFEFLKGASAAGLGSSGASLGIQVVAGTTGVTASAVVLPIIAVVSVAAGLRWAGRAPVPIRAAYVFLHAWKISEYHPNGHVTAVSDLLAEIPTMLREYPINELNREKVLDDLNHLQGLGCLELIRGSPAAVSGGPEDRVIRLLEKVAIKKSLREFF